MRPENTKYNGKDCGFYIDYSQSRNHRTKAKREGRKREKSRLWGFCAPAWEGLSPAFSPQPCVKCFSLGSIKRQGCLPMPDVTSHSLILHTLLSISLLICTHLSPGTSQPLRQSRAGTQTRLMNNSWKDAARLQRENKWRCMSCVHVCVCVCVCVCGGLQ